MHRRELMVGSAAAFGAILSTLGMAAYEPATAKIKRLLIDLEHRDDGLYAIYLNRNGETSEEQIFSVVRCMEGYFEAEDMNSLLIQPHSKQIADG